MARNYGASEDRGARGAHDRDKPLYMISVAAELTGMHPQTLRVYEQKGLVTPGRSRGNTRLYSQADIDRLNLISKLTDEGINLAGVVRIMDMRERARERDEEESTACAHACASSRTRSTSTAYARGLRRLPATMGRAPSRSCEGFSETAATTPPSRRGCFFVARCTDAVARRVSSYWCHWYFQVESNFW